MAASDTIILQRNSGDTGFDERVIAPAVSSLLGFSATKEAVNVTIGTGLTLSGNVLSATASAPAWGAITGTLSDQTDLQTALNAKQATITFGTGVQTALGVNIGSAGAPVLFNGAGGTPSSIVLTNATGTAAGLTAGVASAVAVGGITGLGTGVATALAVNVGSAGAFITFNGNAGTPSALVGTNITGTAAGLTAGTASAVALGGITGLGTGVATALAVNVGSAGAFVTFNGALGTPSSGTVTNLTGTASININGTVGATTPTTIAATTVATSGAVTSTFTGQTADAYFAGLSLINSTTAAASDQQHSPSLVLSGQGWKSTATAASQQVDWRITNVPVQGTSAPTTRLSIASQVNGGGYTDRLTISSAGDVTSSNSLITSAGVEVGSAGYYHFSGRSTIYAPGVGILTMLNSAETSFTRLNFGGTTSSFAALQSSGTTLTVGTADGGTSAGALTVSGTLTASGTFELGHATDTTIARVSAGVISVEGVTVPTISSTSTLTNKTLTDAVNTVTAPGALSIGYLGVPVQEKSAAYTTVMTDAGKGIDHPASDANARTFTIDSNANVALPIGTCITFTNMTANNVTIAITSDTMYLAGTGTTGSRTLAQYGIATARKLTSTTWLISGSGLT